MATNPPAGYSRITPYLLYEDAAAALDWLVEERAGAARRVAPAPSARRDTAAYAKKQRCARPTTGSRSLPLSWHREVRASVPVRLSANAPPG